MWFIASDKVFTSRSDLRPARYAQNKRINKLKDCPISRSPQHFSNGSGCPLHHSPYWSHVAAPKSDSSLSSRGNIPTCDVAHHAPYTGVFALRQRPQTGKFLRETDGASENIAGCPQRCGDINAADDGVGRVTGSVVGRTPTKTQRETNQHRPVGVPRILQHSEHSCEAWAAVHRTRQSELCSSGYHQ